MKLSVIFNLPEDTKKRVLNLQNQIVSQFDNVIKQDTKFHITLVSADDVEDIDQVKNQLKSLIANVNLSIDIGPIRAMVNHKEEGVIYIAADSDKLADLHKSAREILEEHGGKIFFHDFKGHITLAYLDKQLEDTTVLDNIEFSEPIKIGPANANISIKENGEWKKIALFQLSRRIA